MSRLIKELKFFARQDGGSHKTCHDRIRIAGRLGLTLANRSYGCPWLRCP
ncbi:DNA-binding protein [Xenorhabdus mauleonii]|uniref:DNA-binding protein n=1 Tax=Xenorhabdus mauleonii TaxID=351675 RepID=A0A1I3WTP8_9GAMM|nr:DNA-binding protein [Xenorhabdus mauleonii]SFK10918.1 Phage integrase, N-terminal [Xenorhabdus mauleonii]